MRIINLSRQGSAIILTVFGMVFILAMIASYTTMLSSEIITARNQAYTAQVFYIAETGLDYMLWRLYNSNGNIDDLSSTATQTFNAGNNTFSTGTFSYSVTVAEAANGDVTLDSTGTNIDFSAATSFTKQIQLTLTNHALAGAATASSQAPGNPATNANDGSILTAWQAQASGNQWLYVDLGAGSSYTISRIMYCSDIAITRVETSNDALVWTTVGNDYSEPLAAVLPANIYMVFDQVSARYLRLCWDTAVSAPWLYEFFIYSEPESYDLTEDFTG